MVFPKAHGTIYKYRKSIISSNIITKSKQYDIMFKPVCFLLDELTSTWEIYMLFSFALES